MKETIISNHNKQHNSRVECLVLWLTGGIIYFYLEILFRGFSHYSMIICGGFCFLIVGDIGEKLLNSKSRFKILKIIIAGSVVITSFELITGIIVNIRFKMGVWDYSDIPLNVMGQICVPYSVLWGIMSLLCVYLYCIIKKSILTE